VRETKTAYPILVPRNRVEHEVLEHPVMELTDSTWKTLPESLVLKGARQHSMEAPAGMVCLFILCYYYLNIDEHV